MNVKVRILLSICILTILGAVFIIDDLKDEIHHDPEYTVESSAVATDDFGIFFMENWNDMGRLYRIEDSGKVLHMNGSSSVNMETSEDVTFYNGRVYALFSAENSDKDGTFRTYRVGAFDENLKLISISDLFTLDNSWTVSSLTADSLSLYISAIAERGSAVSVYSIPERSMHSAENRDEDTSDPTKSGKEGEITRADYITPDSVLFKERTAERFYVEASYIDSELYVLLDGDTDNSVFQPDARVKTAVDNISFSFGQWIRLHGGLIIKILGIIAIWVILVILSVRLTKDRDRIVYLFSASVVVFFVILFFAFIFIRKQFQQYEINNNSKFALMIMQEDLKYYSSVDYDSSDFFDSTKYYRLMESLTDVLNENENVEIFQDVFVMRKSTGMVLADARGHNGVHASYLYGGDMSTLIEQIRSDPGTKSLTFTMEGEQLAAVAYESENPKDDLVLVAICHDRQSSEGYRTSIRGLGILFVVIFVIGSVMLFISLYLQHLDLKHFSSALKGLAMGDPKIDAPKAVSKDMRELWQCYGELANRIKEINYEKYRIFEAYYRFAPKRIEKIMGKESILDVENGEMSTFTGSVVLLSIEKDAEFEKKVESLSMILTNMEKYADQNEAILISRDQALSNVRFLLMKEQSDTVSQLVQFIYTGSLLGIGGWAVLMYRDMLKYGVAGSRTQSLTYIDSDYSRKMDAYAEWFRQMGVPLVVTEKMMRFQDVGENRYVGCAAFGGDGDVVRFFEILDAYPAPTRQSMLINRTKFEETLELYYSKNFYLARNQFMEILKDCPEDGIARWYIFECEKYMNGEGDVMRSGYIEIPE